MRTTPKVLFLLVLVAGAFAATSLKNKLGYMNAKNLAEVESGFGGEMVCECPNLEGGNLQFGGFPDLPALPECTCAFS